VSDSTLTNRMNAARKAVGDSGEDQKLIRTIARKGLRFVGNVQEGAAHSAERSNSASTSKQPAAPVPRHEIHFCTSVDGVRIAHAEVGQGPPLVEAATGSIILNTIGRARFGVRSCMPSRPTTGWSVMIHAAMDCPTGMWTTSRSTPSCAILNA
jgi:hypothetical protein